MRTVDVCTPRSVGAAMGWEQASKQARMQGRLLFICGSCGSGSCRLQRARVVFGWQAKGRWGTGHAPSLGLYIFAGARTSAGLISLREHCDAAS